MMATHRMPQHRKTRLGRTDASMGRRIRSGRRRRPTRRAARAPTAAGRPERGSRKIANGVDTDVFAPELRTHAERMALWKRFLVDEPRGWRPGCPQGSIRYTRSATSQPSPTATGNRFRSCCSPVDSCASSDCSCSSRPITRCGRPRRAGRYWWSPVGSPASGRASTPTTRCSGSAPKACSSSAGATTTTSSDILTCSDVFAAPSVDEPFGLVYLEAMASGIPPIATTQRRAAVVHQRRS